MAKCSAIPDQYPVNTGNPLPLPITKEQQEDKKEPSQKTRKSRDKPRLI